MVGLTSNLAESNVVVNTFFTSFLSLSLDCLSRTRMKHCETETLYTSETCAVIGGM